MRAQSGKFRSSSQSPNPFNQYSSLKRTQSRGGQQLPTKVRDFKDQTSPPQVLASGHRRCRAAGRVEHRAGASLSVAAGALVVGFPPGGGADITARAPGLSVPRLERRVPGELIYLQTG